ncbi:MAG: hypothetical protein FJ398_11205 [Verrucomicrobia bacterium]|nr:hypothetical protein [Verrucomicrobiota bacterium]
MAAPSANGGFRALASFNAAGQNDYTTGANLDFGSATSPTLTRLNAEGAGFSGERNLQAATTAFRPGIRGICRA